MVMLSIIAVLFLLNACCHGKRKTPCSLRDYLIKEIESNLALLKSLKVPSSTSGSSSGTTYVRWGRTKCRGDATLVYDGFAAGKHYGIGGSGANTLCLPKDPEWKRYKTGTDSLTAKIYGLEIDILHSQQPFSTFFLNKDMPCAVCKTAGRSAVLMIPGKVTCHGGWHKEFSGYLVAQASRNGRTATEYICADENLEALPGGNRDDNEAVVYPVEVGSCTTLKCPPYVAGRELTCVVCSQ